MEDKKTNEHLGAEDISAVSGGASGFRGGYCPYTTDRQCRMEIVGHFDPKNEICRTCDWKAW